VLQGQLMRPLDERPAAAQGMATGLQPIPTIYVKSCVSTRWNQSRSLYYTEGNYFPKRNGPNCLFEIYGQRNPFRFRGYKIFILGEIGPDAEKDSIVGLQSYDEFKPGQEAAGNYGWPLSVGDNKVYLEPDFT